ncbi:homing endonuclease associated repeat-containing protein [Peribacillus frigoritolerans]|uniref:homing endonuclease associated repeat-containing protein n=1 Tax=Peribacillus frigoritolerans TaxID=450367 RepID=UPI0037C60729
MKAEQWSDYVKSQEEILRELKKELIRIGTTKQADYDLMKSQGHVSSSTISRRLGARWSDIILRLDIKNDLTLKALENELKRIGSTNREDYDLLKNPGQLSSSAICRRLELSWREIVAQIGLKPARVLLPKKELLKALESEFERLGSFKKEVYREKRNKQQFPAPRVLIEHLEMSWAQIIKACGATEIREYVADDVSNQELIDEYKKISAKFGQPATIEELKKSTAYTYEIYRQHFGTIGQLRNVCGFKVETKRATPVITKVDCKRELLEIYRKYGRASYSQLQEKSTISMSTMIRKFHTTKINEIWDEVLKDKVDSTADKSTDLSDMS